MFAQVLSRPPALIALGPWMLKRLRWCQPLVRINAEQLLQEINSFRGDHLPHRVTEINHAVYNELQELGDVVGMERRIAGKHVEQDDAGTPDVGLDPILGSHG
eukprot:scaffold105791_cov34-Prasinocladus_malaysianus.AAC.1